MKFKISDKIMTKKEILLYPEGKKKYMIINSHIKGYDLVKRLNIGETIDCSIVNNDDGDDIVDKIHSVKD